MHEANLEGSRYSRRKHVALTIPTIGVRIERYQSSPATAIRSKHFDADFRRKLPVRRLKIVIAKKERKDIRNIRLQRRRDPMEESSGHLRHVRAFKRISRRTIRK